MSRVAQKVTIKGMEFTVPPLAPFDAFHVMRRVSPVLSGIGPQLLKIAVTEDSGAKAASILTMLFSDAGMRLTQMFAMMPDSDVDYVIQKCLGGVTVSQNGHAAKILAEGTAKPMSMFPFVDPGVILRLTIEVLKTELTSFLDVSNYSGVDPKETTPSNG